MMPTIDLMEARVEELRAEGRRAGSGADVIRRPHRLIGSVRKFTRRQR